jgi:gliding motility-associated transport system ATP-binding protein
MIETSKLTKRYGHLTAVDDVSFAVSPGEVLGFLGPNGAGKSTTMRLIAGFLAPSAGSVRVCGFDVETQPVAAKRKLGYLPEGAPCYGEMTPLAFLNFIADLRQLEGERRRTRIAYVIERLHLDKVLHQTIDTLSKGFKRRVGLAQAILHDPEVLILDEPTDGLDPNQKHEVRSLIADMAPNKTIVISTHILEEVHAVCTRAIIIAQGKVVADDTPAALEARSHYHNAVTLRLAPEANAEAVRAQLQALPQVGKVELDSRERRLTAFPRDGAPLLGLLSQLATREAWKVDELQLESGRLDEVFRTITMGDSALS